MFPRADYLIKYSINRPLAKKKQKKEWPQINGIRHEHEKLQDTCKK